MTQQQQAPGRFGPLANLYYLLSSESRLALLERMAKGVTARSELIDLEGIGQSSTAHNLGHLRRAGLLRRSVGQGGVRYEIVESRVRELMDHLGSLIGSSTN